MKSMKNYIILMLALILVVFLYRRYENKLMNEENQFNTEAIQNFLLDDKTLAESKKPILWIHVPYEYNSRHWLSWGSRSSFDLNQPYLYLTVKSIIKFCKKSFTICIIDDKSFDTLIPDWNINMNYISSPISDKMRILGLMSLLYRYGGMLCPISFLCMKDLIDLYNKGTRNNKMGICEMVNRNITSTTYDFYPNLHFCFSPKECPTLKLLIDFIQRTISHDFTAESVFLGEFDRWCESRVRNGEINMISGVDIGVRTVDDKPILTEDLLANNYLNIYPGTYGILINADDILNRNNFGWFSRSSAKQVLQSNTIIGNYLLIANIPDENESKILEPLKMDDSKWVGFWKTPLYPGLYGLKPNFLGDNLAKVPYTGR
jgi:hypothetical protein